MAGYLVEKDVEVFFWLKVLGSKLKVQLKTFNL